jgi:endonuclease YncB( thermonuclease family)
VLRAVLLLALVAGLASCSSNEATSSARVGRVVDGDTIRLADGRRVRLVQIDAPEEAARECYADRATAELRQLLPEGTKVELATDPKLDRVDRFGRLLRYVLVDDRVVNVELVERGAAAPYFFHGDHGRYADDLLRAAHDAQGTRRGLWGACPGAVLDPTRQVATG